MIHARLSDAAQWSGAEHLGQDTEFSGIDIDSRRVRPGSLFVALTGAHHDGHDHLDEAQSRGAVAAFIARPVPASLPLLVAEDTMPALGRVAAAWRRRFQLPVIAVLGSNGKTTVKELIATILRQKEGDAVLSTQGNQNNALAHTGHSVFKVGSHKTFQCQDCRHQTSLIAGTLFQSTYFGGELSGGKAGRGSENKVPFIAALSLDDEGHPLRIKLS